MTVSLTIKPEEVASIKRELEKIGPGDQKGMDLAMIRMLQGRYVGHTYYSFSSKCGCFYYWKAYSPLKNEVQNYDDSMDVSSEAARKVYGRDTSLMYHAHREYACQL